MTAARTAPSLRAILWTCLALTAVLGSRGIVPAASQSQPALDERFGKLPLYFVENRGQADERVEYYLQGKDKSVYFTPHGLVFSLPGKAKGEPPRGHPKAEGGEEMGKRGNGEMASVPLISPFPHCPISPQSAQRYLLNLEFVGSNPEVRLEGEERTPAVVSYLKGPKTEWKAGLKTYSSIVYRNLWPGIDLEYSGTQDRLKYQFLVRPGADPDQIRLRYRGATAVKVNEEGELAVETPAGSFHDQKPYSYQEVAGKQVEVSTSYALAQGTGHGAQGTESPTLCPSPFARCGAERPAAFEYGFRVGEYDRSRPLVLDPAVLVYAGYIGGGSEDLGTDIVVDGDGNAYVCGEVDSSETTFPNGNGFASLPGLPGFDQTLNVSDLFVVKVNPAGTALLYATYIGGSQGEGEGAQMALDGEGNIYVAGGTSSSEAEGFPVTVGPDLTYNGSFSDAYVLKLNAAGTGLDYCGYIGGAGLENGRGIAVDGDGNAYVTGNTGSTETSFPDGDPDMNDMMPAPGFDQTFNGGRFDRDAFVVKVNAAGTALVYATYLGGANSDNSFGIAVDGSGNAYVCGATSSMEGTFPNGNGFASLPGLPGFDQTYNGNAFDFESDAFVAKLNAAGTALLYTTYLGGAEDDGASGIAVDSAGNAYVIGTTGSSEATFPNGTGFASLPGLPGFDQTHNGEDLGFVLRQDAFVVKLNAAGTALLYATYLGGAGTDIVNDIALREETPGNAFAYVSGTTPSTEATFPNGMGFASLPGLVGFDQTHNGGDDAFVVRLNTAGTGLDRATYLGGDGDDGGDNGLFIAMDPRGNVYVAGSTSSTEMTFPNGQGFASLPGVPGPDQTHNGSDFGVEREPFDAFVARFGPPNQPPVIVQCPVSQTVTATSPAGAQVTLNVQVMDADGDPLTVVWNVDGGAPEQTTPVPAGGPPTNATVPFTFQYALGVHTVDVSVSDGINPVVTCPQITLTVVNQPPTLPVCPSSQVVTATSAAGAQVLLEVQVADADGHPLTVVWNVDGGAPEQTTNVPAGGPPTMATVPFTFLYSIGTHTVDVSVSDGIAPPVACPQIMVTVNPLPEPPPPVNQPPTVVCPANVTVTTTSPSGASVALQAQVSDADGNPLTVTWNVDGGVVEETDPVPAGGPPTAATVGFTHTYTVGTHQVVITVSDGIAPPVVCPPVSVTVLLAAGGPGHAGGSGGIATANGIGCFNFGVVGRLRGRASGSLSFKEQALNGSSAALFDGRSIRIDTAVFGGVLGNLTLLVRGQMKTNRYGTVPFQVDALDRGTPGVPKDEFRLTVLADTNRDGIPEPVIFSGKLVTVKGKMNNISLRPGLPPH
jgi:beta-propeller repeat-containing protein